METTPIPLDQLDLNEKARAACERRFTSGIITADNAQPGEEPFIGARAMDLEYSLADLNVEAALREFARMLNLLANAGYLIGLRQAPDVWHREGVSEVRVSMRAMIAPGKYEAAVDLVSQEGAP